VKRRRLFSGVLLVGLALVISLGTQVPANAQESITVRGKVVNGTEGGSVAPGMPVFLHTFQRDSSSVSSMETTTDDSGGFRFDSVASTGDLGYAITMEYAGMRYSTLIGPEDLAGPVELLVYETTQDVSVIEVDHQALIITDVDEKEQQVAATEFVSLTNRSDRTLLPDLSNVGPGQFSFLRFSLPPEVSDFDIQSDLVGGEVIPVGTGFALTSPVVPGEHNLSFSFKFPYENGTFSYQQNLPQGAGVYQVLVPQRLGQIQVSRLESMPSLDAEGSVYQVWEGTNFAPGQGLMVELANLPQPGLLTRFGGWITSEGIWRIVIPSALGMALALVLLYALVWSPRVAAVVVPLNGTQHFNGSSARREALVRAIAALDEKSQQGQIPQAEYQAQRARLKEQISADTTPGSDISDQTNQ
jgi:hypothetical protein